MGILKLQVGVTGLAAVTPNFIYILTNDTFATVTTVGYLNSARNEGYSFAETTMALVFTSNFGCVTLNISLSGNDVSLVSPSAISGVATVSGTLNRITSSGGTNPIIDIAATYVGQTSITTLGAVTTGTWNGTVIDSAHGGTGVNNGASTITIGGNVTFSGAFTSAFTFTGNTAVTFPTSGTLSTTTGTVTSVSGTTDRITVATGTTTAVVDIAATYVGQTSITTLGTITTGVWNGTAVDVAHGGSGVASFTAFMPVLGGTTSTGALQSVVVGGAVAGNVLTYVSAIAAPTWQAISAGTVTSVTGTVDRITVATGTTTPVIDIAATYVGQTSITTLGTITTGTWSGTAVAETHGGTNQTTYALGDTLYASAANTLSKLAGNITAVKQYLSQTGTGAVSAAPAWATISGADITGAALTKTDDTNVTLTLGGAPTAALLNTTSLTLGWAGTLSGTRGGTGVNNGASTITIGGNLAFSGAFATTITVTAGTAVTLPTTGTLVNTAVTTLSSLVSVGTITTGVWNGTAVDVSHGGTGVATLTTPYGVLCAGTTATGAVQTLAALGASGTVLTSNGASALPSFQAAAGGTGTGATTLLTYNPSGPTVVASLNITSVTHSSVGKYIINFTSNYANANYCIQLTNSDSTGSLYTATIGTGVAVPTTAHCNVTGGTVASYLDANYYTAAIFPI
ncbi:MAG: hypothetical protein ABIP54_02230 [Candidatus Andersenbacteria bacterium]